MKFNIYQKGIISIFILALLAIITLFIPYRIESKLLEFYEYKTTTKIIYDSIFSTNTNIDMSRLKFIFETSIIIFIALLLLFSNAKEPDFSSDKIKTKIKREIKYLFLVIATGILTNAYIVYCNYQNEVKLKLIEVNTSRKINFETRKQFFTERKELRDNLAEKLNNFDWGENSNTDTIMNFLFTNRNDQQWKSYFFGELSDWFKSSYGLKNTDDFGLLIENAQYDEKEQECYNTYLDVLSEIKSDENWLKTHRYIYRFEMAKQITFNIFYSIILFFLIRHLFYLGIKLKNYLY
jgi:hypothetical protein